MVKLTKIAAHFSGIVAKEKRMTNDEFFKFCIMRRLKWEWKKRHLETHKKFLKDGEVWIGDKRKKSLSEGNS